jgi:hypothetical protein
MSNVGTPVQRNRRKPGQGGSESTKPVSGGKTKLIPAPHGISAGGSRFAHARQNASICNMWARAATSDTDIVSL